MTLLPAILHPVPQHLSTRSRARWRQWLHAHKPRRVTFKIGRTRFILHW